MSDRDDNDLSACETVNDLIRESGHERATGVAIGGYCRPDSGTRLDTRDGGADRVEEYAAEAGTASLVPSHSLAQLRAGRCDGADRHRPRISRSILRLTSSQDSTRTVPAWMAATRRSISTFQAASASGSGGPSRLPRSSAATSARASTSRRNASARTARAAFVMSRFYRDQSSRRPPTGTMPAARVTSGRPSIPRDDESGNGPRKRCKTRAMIPRETVARGDLAPRNRGCP